MLISIVTPTYNMSDYLKNTIDSILSQTYNDVEYIIMDSNSNDGTLELVLEYKILFGEFYYYENGNLIEYQKNVEGKKLIYCREKDLGPYYAVKKGFSIATGEIFAWLNADDIYYPASFSVVNEIFYKYKNVEWIIGIPSRINEAGQLFSCYPQTKILNYFIKLGYYNKKILGSLQQESMFWRKSLWDASGGINTGYTLAADFELWIRFAKIDKIFFVKSILASFRVRKNLQRSSYLAGDYKNEVDLICEKLNLRFIHKLLRYFLMNRIIRYFTKILIKNNVISYENNAWNKVK
jgi:glycosyltransferase involved in cell wall biosynthesis